MYREKKNLKYSIINSAILWYNLTQVMTFKRQNYLLYE